MRRGVDIGGRDIIIAFNEPAARRGRGEDGKIFSALNARIPSYFLPAVDVASTQPSRPQLYIVSAINMAMRWNARSEKERLVLLINNKLKFAYLKAFFDRFYPDHFSVIEYVVSQDPLRIKDDQFVAIWRELKARFPKRIRKVEESLVRFRKPTLFNGKVSREGLDRYIKEHQAEFEAAAKYAVSHLFVLADMNFDGNYYLNPNGFATIGGHQEAVFNEVRNLAFDLLSEEPGLLQGNEVLVRDNVQVVLEEKENVPPAYNGATKGPGSRRLLDEVTYENERQLSYYNGRPKLKPEMDYLYEHVDRDAYEQFWNDFRPRYEMLKARYEEAYKMRMPT